MSPIGHVCYLKIALLCPKLDALVKERLNNLIGRYLVKVAIFLFNHAFILKGEDLCAKFLSEKTLSANLKRSNELEIFKRSCGSGLTVLFVFETPVGSEPFVRKPKTKKN